LSQTNESATVPKSEIFSELNKALGCSSRGWGEKRPCQYKASEDCDWFPSLGQIVIKPNYLGIV
jgi:hypothetical protein